MADTAIQWTDKVWNCVRGCAIISAGCRNCYAMRQAHRFSRPGAAYEGLTQLTKRGPVWTGTARFVPDKLPEPLTWAAPARVFVNSMSDLFHGDVTDRQIAAVFGVMAICPHLTFQILTKRPARMVQWFDGAKRSAETHGGTIFDACLFAARYESTQPEAIERLERVRISGVSFGWPLPNVWLGVSVEDQETADARIPLLLQTPAAVRFISAEPLLGPIDMSPFLVSFDGVLMCARCGYRTNRAGEPCPNDGAVLIPDRHIDWVIAGGESGYDARPCCLSWLRNIVHDCWAAGVPLFVKQLGAKPYEAVDEAPLDDGSWPVDRWIGLQDGKGGDPLEWGQYLRVRQFPGVRHG